MEDSEILDLLYIHSENGLGQLSDKYGKLILSIAFNVLNDYSDAEECVNDTYMKMWNIIPPYRPQHFRPFLCKIARQISIDKYRQSQTRQKGSGFKVLLSELENDIADKYSFDDETDSRILSDYINAYISSLKIESRVLFIRRYFFAESVKDLAKRFEISESNVGIKLFRIRNDLKKYLEKRGYHIENE
ncbi:hypothetical protein SDC9_129809 [bioreactor metagenome]|uniref:ECF RNA polymerase sigma factor SigW n=1 Tax=bioreactor metagenome TaxID=1076179 RepID=A0A645D0P0_9ZZZZ|nr:sigma-70 family RNA polymerase sigma factor [Oscillospiraceae bacterium]